MPRYRVYPQHSPRGAAPQHTTLTAEGSGRQAEALAEQLAQMTGIADADLVGELRQAVAGVEQAPAHVLQAQLVPIFARAHALAGVKQAIQLTPADTDAGRQLLDAIGAGQAMAHQGDGAVDMALAARCGVQ